MLSTTRALWPDVLTQLCLSRCLPTVKQQSVERTLNGSGIRDIVCVLQVGPNPVLKEFKKSVRPLAGKHKRGGRGLSGRAHGRSAPRGGGRGGGVVSVAKLTNAGYGMRLIT